MAVIILATKHDTHAVAVAYGLRKVGIDAVIWGGIGWEPETTATIVYDGPPRVYLGQREITSNDTIWFRRPLTTTPHPGVHRDDVKYATDEYRAFHQALLRQLEMTGAVCINNWGIAVRLEQKTVQLTIARNVGLSVPTTVMTNAATLLPNRFRDGSTICVHKSFRPHTWVEQGISHHAETSTIEGGLTFQDEVFGYAPGIYQERIKKQYDVRVLLIGDVLRSFRIDGSARYTDWRLDFMVGNAAVHRIQMPKEIADQVIQFANIAGLVFASFDFAVDTDDQWWFLEVNQSGQFLWIDEALPEEGPFPSVLRLLGAGQRGEDSSSDAHWPNYAQIRAELVIPEYMEEINEQTPHVTIEQQVMGTE